MLFGLYASLPFKNLHTGGIELFVEVVILFDLMLIAGFSVLILNFWGFGFMGSEFPFAALIIVTCWIGAVTLLVTFGGLLFYSFFGD